MPEIGQMNGRRVIKSGQSEVTIHEHGATIISWKFNGREILFCSKLALLDGSKAIRGGIPLVFPQFGTGDIMAGQHGFARNLPWKITLSNDQSEALCELEDSEKTLAQWPHKFNLSYKVSFLEDGSLKTSLSAKNTGDKAFKFTALLHTYFRVPSITTTEVRGLLGLKYSDKLDGGKIHEETRNVIKIDSEVDRNYISFPHKADLTFPGAKVALTTDQGFPDLVLWNPWVEKSRALADFDDEEYKEMVCLEAGKIIEPVYLEPNQTWSGSQTLSVALDN